MNVKSNKLLLTGLLFLFLVVFRILMNNPILISGISYYNIRASNLINEQIIIQSDTLSNGLYDFSLFHYIISVIPDFLISYIPLILGIITLALTYNLHHKKSRALTTALLVTSPLFLYHFMTLTSISFAMVFSLLALRSFKESKILGFTIFNSLLALTNFPIWLVSNIYFLYKKTPILAIIPGLILSFATINYTLQPTQLLFDFGSIIGYSLIFLILSIIGVIMSWSKKQLMPILLIVLMFVYSIFSTDSRIMVLYILLPYASDVIEKINNRHYEVTQLKNVTIYLVFLIVAFSAISQTATLIDSSPNTTDLIALNHLKNYPDGNVISNEENAFYIQYYANKKTITDPNTINNSKQFFDSQDVDLVVDYILKNNVKYIYVNRTEERSGFLFIADNAPGFERLYYDKKIEIWTLNPLNQIN